MGSEQKLQSKSASLQVKEVLPHTATRFERGARGIRAKTAEQIGFLTGQGGAAAHGHVLREGGRVGSEQKLQSKSASLQVKEVLPHTATRFERGARGIRAKTAEQIGFLTG